jgi:hypothetical protein
LLHLEIGWHVFGKHDRRERQYMDQAYGAV